MNKNKLSVGFAISVIVAFSSVAHAAVIDFESASTAGCQVTAGGSTGGFTLGSYDNNNSGAGFNNSSACSFINPAANSGQNYMVNFNDVFGEFTKDVGDFTLDSLFVHADIREGDTTVLFQGLDGVDGALLYSLSVDITSSWQKIEFAGWDNVKTFTWDSISPGISNISIDDFEYDAVSRPPSVPEPMMISLLGFGLAGLGFSRKKKIA